MGHREGASTQDPRDKSATMPDPRGRTLFPEAECVAPGRQATSGPSPRCVISFDRPLTAVGIAPGGTLAIVALAHAATVAWTLPAAVASLLFEPLPAATEARAILVDDARSRALFAVEEQVWRYDTSTGRVVERIDGAGGTIEQVAWARGGSLIATIGATDGQASLLGARRDGAREDDGSDTQAPRTLATPARAVHVALDDTATHAAVATETGEIVIFDLATGDSPRVLEASSQPAAAIAFARDRLLVAGSDGVLRSFDPDTAQETARIDTGSPLAQLAVAPDGARAATAARGGLVRLHDLPDLSVTATLAWHEANIAALGFAAGPTLISADNEGQVAVWDLERR
jgi:hypothetical protein